MSQPTLCAVASLLLAWGAPANADAPVPAAPASCMAAPAGDHAASAELQASPGMSAMVGVLPGSGWSTRTGAARPAAELIGSLTGFFERMWQASDGDPSQLSAFWMSGQETWRSLEPIPTERCADLVVSERGFSSVEALIYEFSTEEEAKKALDVRIQGAKYSVPIASRMDPGKSTMPLIIVSSASRFNKAVNPTAGIEEAWRLVGRNGSKRILEFWALSGVRLSALFASDLNVSSGDAVQALARMATPGLTGSSEVDSRR